MGHFALVDGQEMVDLGDKFDCLVIDWRPKALRTGEQMEILYDPSSEQFKKIVVESEVKDSGCMFGVEFLLWIPGKGFIPYYLNNTSSRYEAKPMRALIGKAATVKVIFIKGKQYSWHAPKVSSCSVPFESLPTEEEIRNEVKGFRTPENSIQDMAAEAGKNDRAR